MTDDDIIEMIIQIEKRVNNGLPIVVMRPEELLLILQSLAHSRGIFCY